MTRRDGLLDLLDSVFLGELSGGRKRVIFFNMDNLSDYNHNWRQYQGARKKRRGWKLIFIILVLILGLVFIFGAKITSTFSRIYTIDGNSGGELPIEENFEPFYDKNRLNVLILGIRGIDDPNGGLLTDSIIVASFKKDTNQTALISIPRDLYVKIPGVSKKEKINAAYAIGGLPLAKRTVEIVSGLAIDYSASVNFRAFEEFIDAIGGITINLDKYFHEGEQWANYPEHISEENLKYWAVNDETGKWQFTLPAGENWLDGETALYYVRARLQTSDFDRAKRQQQIILAAKDKLLSLGVLANPFRAYKLLDILGDNIKTDADSGAVKKLLNLAGDAAIVKQVVLDTSEGGLLIENNIDGAFVLLPASGNYDAIRESAKNIFQD